MRYSFTALVLATATISGVVAQPARHGHQAFHEKKDVIVETPIEAAAEAEAEPVKREAEADLKDVDWKNAVDWSKVSYTYLPGQFGEPTPAPVAPAAPAAATAAPVADAPAPPAPGQNTPSTGAISTKLTSVAADTLTKLGVAGAGINALTKAGGFWIGDDGDYTNEFTNASGDDLIVVCWGSWASWVNVKTPLITVSLAPGEKTTISFVDGSIGACSAIYPDTKMVNGQISNTWAEFTYTSSGVINISREVNMKGHNISVVGPTCTTDMNTCVFVCDSGDVCTTGYSLKNCDNGSQKGATSGFHEGAASGGCGWNGAKTVAHKTTLS